MTTFTVEPRKVQTGGGRRGPGDHREFGGDGGGRGDGVPDHGERLRRYRLGLALALVAITLLFLASSVALIARQGLGRWDVETQSYIQDWRPVELPVALISVNTLILLFSSFCIEKARRQAAERAVLAPIAGMPGIDFGPRHPMPWLALSAAGGLTFLAGQALTWRELVGYGLNMNAAPISAFFYVLTGAHAIHLVGGLIAMLYAGATTSLFSRSLDTRRIAVDITAWYWHAMGVLWIYILLVLAVSSRL